VLILGLKFEEIPKLYRGAAISGDPQVNALISLGLDRMSGITYIWS